MWEKGASVGASVCEERHRCGGRTGVRRGKEQLCGEEEQVYGVEK